MKKTYERPSLKAVEFEAVGPILDPTVTNVSGNSGLKYGGGGSGEARSNERDNRNDAEWGNLW